MYQICYTIPSKQKLRKQKKKIINNNNNNNNKELALWIQEDVYKEVPNKGQNLFQPTG